MQFEVPKVVVLRLPLYMRVLTNLLAEGASVVSSQQLGSRLQMTSAQIRKDLSYFGRFGKQGKGYDVGFLLSELRQILGLDREWRACLIGMGRLGRAIIAYPGFAPEGFEVLAAFDNDSTKAGQVIDGLRVQPMSEFSETIYKKEISIAILAVPSDEAQAVIDLLIQNRILGILNYAPLAPQVPDGIVIMNIDPVLSLQSITFYLRQLI